MRTAVRGDCLSVVGVPGDEDAYTSALAQLSSILPYGELSNGMKIEISANERQCLAAVKCCVVPGRVSTLVTLRATKVAARLL